MSGTPLSLTPLIGRDQELTALCRLLESTRLLTLTGAGGSGKTRLASEVAALSSTKFADGVVWVELAPLAEPELLPEYVLGALGVEQGPRTPMAALQETLRDRETLLLLDNCEHLVDACAGLTDALLRGCQRLSVLATSREALGVGGERAWLVPGLTLPAGDAGGGGHTAEAIADVPAVRLFVDRAQAASASFELTAVNAHAVVQICRRLDGLPLAIELAAARVRALPPEELATRLDDTFRVLTSGSRTAVSRHRTLREAIDWSYNLLDDRERTLLQVLSTFAGDFTLQAAETVVSSAALGIDPGDALDILAALVDKSLVVMRESEGTARFALLETIRQYAHGRLEESGWLHEVCSRHARTYMDLVAQAAPHLITRDRPHWVQRIQRELDNIRVALACTRDNHAGGHLWLNGNLGWFWYSSGLWSEGRRWLEGAIALPATIDKDRASRAAVLRGAGVLASLQSDIAAALPWLQESAALYRAVGDRSGEAYALAYHGVCYGQTGDERAIEPTTRALEYFREAGDPYGVRLGLVVLATTYSVRADLERARPLAEEAVAVARTFGLDRELGITLQVLGGVSMAVGDVPRAADLYRESLAALRRDPSLFWTQRVLQMLAVATFRLGAAEHGARLVGASEVISERLGAGLFGHHRDQLTNAMAVARQAIGDGAFEAARNAGRAASLEQVLEEAITAGPSGATRPTARPQAMSDTRALDVRALGPLEMYRDGVELRREAWRYARPRELLLYLLSHPEGRTREQIGLVFWPDASATQVKNNFHVMLHHVRKAIGRADLVAFDRERYRIAWELGVHFDAREFEDRVRPAIRPLRSARTPADVSREFAKLRDALALYRGDLLADEEVGDWHLEVRDRLRRLYCDALLVVGERTMEQGSYEEAAEAFRRAVEVDELHEEAHRRLMLTLARAGDRSEALRQYERLARTLRSDLEAEPDAETKALYERLRKAETV